MSRASTTVRSSCRRCSVVSVFIPALRHHDGSLLELLKQLLLRSFSTGLHLFRSLLAGAAQLDVVGFGLHQLVRPGCVHPRKAVSSAAVLGPQASMRCGQLNQALPARCPLRPSDLGNIQAFQNPITVGLLNLSASSLPPPIAPILLLKTSVVVLPRFDQCGTQGICQRFVPGSVPGPPNQSRLRLAAMASICGCASFAASNPLGMALRVTAGAL